MAKAAFGGMRLFCRRQNRVSQAAAPITGKGSATFRGHCLPVLLKLNFSLSLCYLFPPLLWKRSYLVFLLSFQNIL